MFLVFAGQSYYAQGGGYDLISCHDLEADAVKSAENLISKFAIYDLDYNFGCDIEWAHVLSTTTGKIVAVFGELPHGPNEQAKTIVDEEPV